MNKNRWGLVMAQPFRARAVLTEDLGSISTRGLTTPVPEDPVPLLVSMVTSRTWYTDRQNTRTLDYF